jgi:predicted AAA+ superfamily ATPase
MADARFDLAFANRALFPRFSAELLKDTAVVMVTGPRQCGKTTLFRDLVAGNREFITMDDDTVLAAARSDSTEFVRALDRTTIDKVQRVPDFLRAIKKSVDDGSPSSAVQKRYKSRLEAS